MHASGDYEKTVYPSFIVQYTNDATAVNYSDGSSLQLSACGSSFSFTSSPLDQHLLHGSRTIQQRTQFATSLYKPKVQHLLQFRNLVAERPFICADLLQRQDFQRVAADIDLVSWPKFLSSANIDLLTDGSLCLVSLDSWAKFTLAPCRQYFTVEYLSHVSLKKKSKAEFSRLEDASVSHASSDKVQPVEKSGHEQKRIEKLLKYCIKTDLSSTQLSSGQSSHACDVTSSTHEHERLYPEDVIIREWQYVWVKQQFSVFNCPVRWKHPLTLIVTYAQSLRRVVFDDTCKDPTDTKESEDSQTKESKNISTPQGTTELLQLDLSETADNNENNGVYEVMQSVPGQRSLVKCVRTPVSSPLPLTCPSPHLHKWDQQMWTAEGTAFPGVSETNGRIQTVVANQVMFRLCWDEPRALEIYPGDGSFLRTSGISGHFFVHYIYKNAKVEEKMYSVLQPPPDGPSFKYSIQNILARASRLLSYLHDDNLQLQSKCCWRPSPSPPSASSHIASPVMLEECTVPGVGQFSAYSSGRIRVLFTDRTALDMWADFTKRMEQSGNIFDKIPPEIPLGVCRLLLPNGHYQHVLVSQPMDNYRYVRAAQEWINWVNSTPGQRAEFYADTIYDPVKQSEIQCELNKIQCLNFVMEQTLLSQFKQHEEKLEDQSRYSSSSYFPSLAHLTLSAQAGSNPSTDISYEVVNAALEKTSQTIAELDQLLQKSRPK